jgi:hypothetical protein
MHTRTSAQTYAAIISGKTPCENAETINAAVIPAPPETVLTDALLLPVIILTAIHTSNAAEKEIVQSPGKSTYIRIPDAAADNAYEKGNAAASTTEKGERSIEKSASEIISVTAADNAIPGIKILFLFFRDIFYIPFRNFMVKTNSPWF